MKKRSKSELHRIAFGEPRGTKKVHVTRHFKRYRQFPPSRCSPGSFRTKRVGRGKRTRLLTVCCPKGHWSRKRRRCKAGTRVQSILKRRA